MLTPVPGTSDLGFVDALAQLSFALQGLLARVAATHDLTVVQARLLGIVRDRRPTITELAAYLQLDKTSVTKLVDRAEAKGLVRRARSTADARSINVSITALGRRVVETATVTIQAEIEAIAAELGVAQRDELSRMASVLVLADARRRGVDLRGDTH